MTDVFARWNLRPSERRLVVVVGLVLFVVINLVWVRPHFSDWKKMTKRMADARAKREIYEKEIAKLSTYRAQVKELEGEGASVPLQDQALQFARTVNAQAAESRVSILGSSRPTVRTNQFFIEQIQNFTMQGEEKNLVDFLYNLGSGNSMIRVLDMEVHPDGSRQLLSTTVKVIASYQKIFTAPAKPATTPAPATPVPAASKPVTPAVAAKPATNHTRLTTNQLKPAATRVAPTKK